MKPDDIFFWLPVLSCGALLVRMASRARSGQNWSWLIVAGAILAVAGVGTVFFPTYVGEVTVSLWAVFVLLPSLLTRAVQREVLAQRYQRARYLAAAVRLLHPAGGWREQIQLCRAMALSESGQGDEAAAVLTNLMAHPRTSPVIVQTAQVQIFRLRGQWEELLAWVDGMIATGRGSKLAFDFTLSPTRLRALGETARLSDMLKAFQGARLRLEHFPQPMLWPTCQLFVFALAGRESATAALLEGPLAGMREDSKTFWRATAQMRAGQEILARTTLQRLADSSSNRDLQLAVKNRLTRGLVDAGEVLLPEEKELLLRLEREGVRDLAYHARSGPGLRRAYATLTLIALNLVVFSLEMARGGSENLQTLLDLGALWPPAVLEGGEWYRVVAAMFLHLGPVHLGMNLLGLAVIGPGVEKALGWARYVAVYFVAGIGSMLAVLGFIRWGWMPDEVLVGASGAIMGLVGALGALMAAGWWRDRSRMAARRLGSVGVIVAFQVVFDLLTPQVSLAAHATGVMIGFLATGCVLTFRKRKT